MHDAMKEELQLLAGLSGNVNHHFDIPRGDIDSVFKNAYLVHEGEYETQARISGIY